MIINVYTVSIAISILFLVGVVELVRKNRLREKYSLLWILMSIVLLVLSSTPFFINTIAGWLDIKNPPSLLFFFGLVYLVFYNLHITVVFSKQSDRVTRLAQELALVKKQLEETKDKKDKWN